jgi:hypothetical protein
VEPEDESATGSVILFVGSETALDQGVGPGTSSRTC